MGEVYRSHDTKLNRDVALKILPGAFAQDAERLARFKRERLARGPLSVDEALAIARPIAEALEAAHEQGIVHRDLRPAKIKKSATTGP